MGQTNDECYCDYCGRLIAADQEPVTYHNWTFHSDWCRAGKFKLIQTAEKKYLTETDYHPKRILPKGVH